MAYSIINAIVSGSGGALTAAEAHGLASGMLCADRHAKSDFWLTHILQDTTTVSDEQNTLLVRLFEETRRLLASDGYEFSLFLPDEINDLSGQVQALINWCDGFLFGVGTVYSDPNPSKEVREILKDISEFTKIDDNVEGEEDAFALMEVTEYLKSAVLLLREELHSHTGNHS